MFSGIYEHSIDEKGRISLPARLRDDCFPDGSSSVILACHISDKCLQLYTKKSWEELLAKIAEKPQFTPQMINFKRLFVATAMECQPDAHGRIVIPGVHRQYAGLTKEVVWAGMIDNLELWNRDTYYAWREQSLARPDLLQDISSLGL